LSWGETRTTISSLVITFHKKMYGMEFEARMDIPEPLKEWLDEFDQGKWPEYEE
jgi:hypothetical protein